MQPQDVFNRTFETTTAALDRWLDTIATDALIDRERTSEFWRVRLRPHQANACPVELMLSRGQTFDLDIGSESAVGHPVVNFSLFLPLLQAIAEGHVTHRAWSAQATGSVLTHEMIVRLPDGQDWTMRRLIMAGTAATELSAVARERSYVPYRRSEVAPPKA